MNPLTERSVIAAMAFIGGQIHRFSPEPHQSKFLLRVVRLMLLCYQLSVVNRPLKTTGHLVTSTVTKDAQ
jgi:hypothetical protein